MKIPAFFHRNYQLFIYLILAFFSVAAFFTNGFFIVHDSVQPARIFEMAKGLLDGNFPVRWAPDLGFGLGYPLFNFYSVLPYYIGGLVTLLGFDIITATKFVFVLGILGSGISMYFFAKAFFGRTAALCASIIYLYFPYHAVNIYVRGDLAELCAYAILPLIFLSLFKIHISEKFTKLYVILGSVSLACLIITHNLSFFMLLPFMGIFVVLSTVFSENKKTLLISYVTIFVMAFLLSAFYSVPAALEAKYTNVTTQVGGGADWRDHFVCLPQLWDSPWGFGGSAKGCADGLSFRLGKSNILLILVSVIMFIFSFKKLKEKRFLIGISFAFLLLSVFMTLEYSAFLWSIPFMDFLQYPWRFLNFTGLFTGILGGALAFMLIEKYKNSEIYVVTVIIALTLFLNAKLFVPQKIINLEPSDYTNMYYLNWTASKISDEYLPKGFNEPASVSQVAFSMDRIPAKIDDLFVKTNDQAHFDMRQTSLQSASNILSIIGVISLALVIMDKFKFLYGKKTS